MRALTAGIAALVTLSGCAKKPATCQPPGSFAATGYFRVEHACGNPLLVDQQGKPFFSFGANHISWAADTDQVTNMSPYENAVMARYGTPQVWAQAEVQRLHEWGFNTAGAWSDAAIGALMPYTIIMNLSGADWSTGSVPDYFDPAWEMSVQSGAQSGTAGHSKDPNLIGYFIDNEIHWAPDWRTDLDLLQDFMLLGAEAPGKQTLVNLMSQRHNGDIASFNAAWQTSFTGFEALAAATTLPSAPLSSKAANADRSAFISLVSDRFFEVTAGAIRAGDPNHLVLGVRFVAQFIPREAAAAAGKYCDVVSANDYEFIIDAQTIYPPDQYNMVNLDTPEFFSDFYAASGAPLLVSEFGWRAADSGLPNTWPPVYPTLATQTDRANSFQQFAQSALASPWMVGYHWFEFADEPPGGRVGDGENSNWGLVNLNDDPYTVVTSRTTAVNHWTAP